MSREKAFISILMVLILIVLSGASVWAAPNGQDLISGIVDTIVIVDGGVDPDTGDPIFIVRVTLVDESGGFLEVDLYLDAAAQLGLVKVDDEGKPVLDPDTGYPIPDETKYETEVNIPETDVIPEEDGVATQHPVALALAEHFGKELDIMGAHEAGFGFGLIAQACWMSYALKGDATLFREILDDKQDGNGFEFEITLPADGTTMTTTTTIAAKNWGQFRKAVLRSEKVQIKKNLANLGAIMSGRAEKPGGTDNGDEDENENELGATSTQGKVKGQKDKAGGKPKIPPGQVKKSGKPDTPPGKGKNKDKGGGKKQ